MPTFQSFPRSESPVSAVPGRTLRDSARDDLQDCGNAFMRTRCLSAVLWVALLWGLSVEAFALQPSGGSLPALQATRQALQSQLQASAFGEPLVLSSRELSDRLEGDVYAEVAHPFALVGGAFRTPAGICEVLLLHLNVRSCTPSKDREGGGMTLVGGPKQSGSPGMAYSMRYAVRTEAAEAAYLRVILSAAKGPLSTRDYHMVFEAIPIDSDHSFVHVGYGYSFGTLAKLAMNTYLATAGRSKIGFTVEDLDASGRAVPVRGERAAIECNVMRYYLALLAHLSVTSGTREALWEARWRAWFALTERHAAQLHEYSLEDYLKEKRSDLARSAVAK